MQVDNQVYGCMCDHVYIHMYVRECVCVCILDKQRWRERECVCLCVARRRHSNKSSKKSERERAFRSRRFFPSLSPLRSFNAVVSAVHFRTEKRALHTTVLQRPMFESPLYTLRKISCSAAGAALYATLKICLSSAAFIHIHTNVHTCVHVCLCVCDREREREEGVFECAH